MSVAIIIPCRFGSSRFPGKPLARIAGRSMIERVWRIANAIRGVDSVFIATDDQRIAEHATSFGGLVAMTSPDCRNGTERCFEVAKAQSIKPSIVLNLQGDAVLTPPHVLDALVAVMTQPKAPLLATPAVRLGKAQHQQMLEARGSAAGGTFVTFNLNKQALYFSKSSIPFLRRADADSHPVYRHIGLYAYQYAVLEQLVKLPPTPLEEAEQLEQLRALEHGIPIQIVPVEYGGRSHWSVDKPEDVAIAEKIIASEGELVP